MGRKKHISTKGKVAVKSKTALKAKVIDNVADIDNLILKSPSDTTVYAPAVCKNVSSPMGIIQGNRLTRDVPDFGIGINGQVSDFVDEIRRQQYGNGQPTNRSELQRDTGRVEHNDYDQERETTPTRTQGNQKQTSAARLVIEAEKFKAAISNPKGKNVDQAANKDDNDLSQNIAELINLLKSKSVMSQEVDNDDDFMHVMCHIDANMKAKIGRGEFIELDKLLPKSRSQIMGGGAVASATDIEVVRKDGLTYRLPDGNKEARITNVRRWEQGFRVYAAIYSEINPQRSAEIWQYVHIINTAATSYSWENVAFYDYTFRQLMERKPHRSWAKIYTQMWNLAMTDHIHKISHQNFNQNNGFSNPPNQSSSHQKTGDWRDKCCWRFNKGRCTKWNCRFDHRCNVKECGSYSHSANQCNKKKKQTQVKSEKPRQ